MEDDFIIRGYISLIGQIIININQLLIVFIFSWINMTDHYYIFWTNFQVLIQYSIHDYSSYEPKFDNSCVWYLYEI